MSKNLIFGSKLEPFNVGVPVTNKNTISRFVAEGSDVQYGALLKYGSDLDLFEVMTGAETDDAEFAGIAVAEQSVTPTTYPGTASFVKENGYGSLLLEGDIPVPTNDDLDNIKAGGRVYLDPATGLVTSEPDDGATPTPADHLELTALRFTGQKALVNGVKLAVVRKRIF